MSEKSCTSMSAPIQAVLELLMSKIYESRFPHLVGAYPFEDPGEPKNFRKTIHRITIPEIRNHEWFLKNLPADLTVENTMNNQFEEPGQPVQGLDVIMQMTAVATIPAAGTNSLNRYLLHSLDVDNKEEDLESDPDIDIDSNGDSLCNLVGTMLCFGGGSRASGSSEHHR
ncbi:serine/threonine-protein kinase SRK2E-like [Pyrus x bretschneideri]|uniref:serine/threonine-protein kinase SRK2E-like n=1 Tax=Pyrus x bretschneideri TaxID=225117 RepID=UPI002030F9CC|nr:serine/threonine-protein kinase SRK2E-like [Pyrus x bretschneideri]